MQTRITVRGAPRSSWWRGDASALAVVALLFAGLHWLGGRPAIEKLSPDDPVQRNRLLRREIADLETQQLLHREGLRESVRLELLQEVARELSDRGLKFVAATVAPGKGTHIRLGRGQRSQIGARDTVVAPAGLVGRVVSVDEFSSEAALLIDESVGVAVRIEPPGAAAVARQAPGRDETEAAEQPEELRGIVTGGRTDGLLTLGYLTSSRGVIRGAKVVTSGLGGVYPEGLPIGVVEDAPMTRPGQPPEATVKPYVEWTRLREVLIVRQPGGVGESS